MGSNGEQTSTRDIKNHLLFEVATEVAHRGKRRDILAPCSNIANLSPL